MNIRIAKHEDGDAIQQVHLSAFPESEAEMVAKLALDLLVEQTIPITRSLVAEIDTAIVGQVSSVAFKK